MALQLTKMEVVRRNLYFNTKLDLITGLLIWTTLMRIHSMLDMMESIGVRLGRRALALP